MMDKLIKWSVDNRYLVVGIAAAFTLFGVIVCAGVSVDVFPDLTAPTVVALTEASGMSPADVVDELIRLAFAAHAEKRKTVYNYKTGLIDHAAARGLKGIKK